MMVEIMGTQQAVDGVDGLSLDLSPVDRFLIVFRNPSISLQVEMTEIFTVTIH